MFPGASLFHPKHKEGCCQRNFTCQNPVHNNSRYPTRKHVLVCEDHKHENDQLLTQYKDMLLRKREQLPPFVKDMGLHFNHHEGHHSSTNNDNAIYQLQAISINNQQLLIFYDSDCSDFVSRFDAIQRLPLTHCTQEYAGPIRLGGIGDSTIESVSVDFEKHETIASLPLLHNPAIRLNPNRSKALKVYQQQVKKLSKFPNDKNDVIASERKLHDLGHVDYVENLSTEQQIQLRINPIQNFIPWRAVWKANSISTPCRIVFDASQPTSSGLSLNNICAKGHNNMNKIIEIKYQTHWLSYRHK